MRMIEVELIDHMGNDTTVAKAARVSYQADQYKTQDDNVRLINYLAEHGHWSPFAHCFMQLRIKAPLFVARQLAKHQVGLSWNEVSRRYVDKPPEFFEPDFWRGRAKTNKQGSSGHIEEQHEADKMIADVHQGIEVAYKQLLELGVAPEQARMILPQTMITEWFWSGSLCAFARVCDQRDHDDSQTETRKVAWEIDRHGEQLFPASWAALRH